jgi:hypothetical protein
MKLKVAISRKAKHIVVYSLNAFGVGKALDFQAT